VVRPRGALTHATRRAETATKHSTSCDETPRCLEDANITAAPARRVHWVDEDAQAKEMLAKEAEYVLAMFEMAWDGTL